MTMAAYPVEKLSMYKKKQTGKINRKSKKLCWNLDYKHQLLLL